MSAPPTASSTVRKRRRSPNTGVLKHWSVQGKRAPAVARGCFLASLRTSHPQSFLVVPTEAGTQNALEGRPAERTAKAGPRTPWQEWHAKDWIPAFSGMTAATFFAGRLNFETLARLKNAGS